MVNSTVNRIGKAAGNADKTKINMMQALETGEGLKVLGIASRTANVEKEGYISIKLYPNTNKGRDEERA